MNPAINRETEIRPDHLSSYEYDPNGNTDLPF
jgi:hypothetical protein